MFKHCFLIILALLPGLPVLAQPAHPGIEIVLSTAQAQRGATVYADVNIRNGQAVAGADVGISTDDCLRVIERQPGNYLPATGENGGFAVFDEVNEHGTRLATAVTDRGRVANGDGTFFRVAMEVVCDEAAAQVTVSFAQLAALADPNSASNELLSYSVEEGNLPVVNNVLTVQQGAIAATAVPLAMTGSWSQPAGTPPLLYAAIGLLSCAVVGLSLMFAVYRRRNRRS